MHQPQLTPAANALDQLSRGLEAVAQQLRAVAYHANRSAPAARDDFAQRAIDLENALAAWGAHRAGCQALAAGECCCGWDDARKQFLAPVGSGKETGCVHS